ncbi:MAG: hypothetical protein QOD75_2949 [Blastocatellia bacterium]|nr:hypothetical protein [Blastocatellia bacterium]
MKAKSLILVLSCGLALSCSQSGSTSQPLASQPATPPSGAAATTTSTPGTSASVVPGSKVDSCKVLTSDELKSVLGEALKETKASDRADGGFNVSQCFYTLPTFSKSVSLSITSSGTRDVREFWKETFHREEAEEKDRERKREKEKGSKDEKERRTEKKEGRGEEEEEGAPPQKVPGTGEEAFWVGSPIGGALYVLKKNIFFRISIGGSDNQQTKLNKSKTLALRILARV